MAYVLIVGAKSDMAKSIAKEYASHGYDLYLASRKSEALDVFAKDLSVSAKVVIKCIEWDAVQYDDHKDFYKGLPEKPVGVISAVGYLGDQEKAQDDFVEAQMIMSANYIGLVSLFNIIANDFENRRGGFIIGIGSVAGDRGRKKNYIYGSAKAALSTYLSGLRNRLYSSGVYVLTVKPGFVETKMTRGMNLPKILTDQPENVAQCIYKAQQKGKDVIYVKGVWKYIMQMIALIPEKIFKTMDV